MKNGGNVSNGGINHHEEDWLRYQELRKHSNMSSGLGLNQFNMFNSKFDARAIICATSSKLLNFQMKTTLTTCLHRTR